LLKITLDERERKREREAHTYTRTSPQHAGRNHISGESLISDSARVAWISNTHTDTHTHMERETHTHKYTSPQPPACR